MMPKGLMQFQLGIKRVINCTTLISASNANISKSKRKNEFEKTLDPASTSNFAIEYMGGGGE